MSAVLRSVSPDPVEAEFAKDIWDVRCIPGTRYSACRSTFYLKFTQVSPAFLPLVKRYMRLMVTQYTVDHCINKIRFLQLFFDFFSARHPNTAHFRHLSREDVEAYLLSLRTKPGRQWSAGMMGYAISTLKQFLEYLERTSAAEAPRVPVAKLVWQSDFGRRPDYYSGGTVKYIPEGVLQQLDQHLQQLPAADVPIVILLRASGWRIADVLNLRYDSCLEQTPSGWWLCGDILKTQVLNHRVPISEEIAALVAAQRTVV